MGLRRLTTLIVLLAVVALAAGFTACTSNKPPSPTPATTPDFATPTPPAIALDGISVVPPPPISQSYPRGTRTNIPVVDALLAEVERGDAASIGKRVAIQQVACDVRRTDSLRPPDCPPGVAGATLIDVIGVPECRGSFVPPAEVPTVVGDFLAKGRLLYGVALPASADPPVYEVVFAPEAGEGGSSVTIGHDGRIIRIGGACSADISAALFFPTADRAIVVEPPATRLADTRRTGILVVDAELDRLLARGAGALVPVLGDIAVPCTNLPRQLGSPPACDPGSAEGTTVRRLLITNGCEGEYFSRGIRLPRELLRLQRTTRSLKGVYRGPDLYAGSDYAPLAAFVVLFEQFTGLAITFDLDAEGKVYWIAERCGQTPAQVERELNRPNLLKP